MDKKERLYLWLTGISVAAFIASNLLAVKLIDVMGISYDAGVILYPVTYIVGDLIMEFFGRKSANLIAVISFFLDFAITGVLMLAVWLPAYPGWGGQESFAAVFGAAPRIVLASGAAYLVSSLLNNYVFERIKERGGSLFFSRALGSSAVAKIADTLVFETVAFLGVLSFQEFAVQALAAYFTAIVLEAILFALITRPVHALICRHLFD